MEEKMISKTKDYKMENLERKLTKIYEKLLDLEELFNEMANWKEESQNQKEVYDKAIEFTNKKWGTWCTHHLEYMTELQNILKEVSE